jgi:hypothetical protein
MWIPVRGGGGGGGFFPWGRGMHLPCKEVLSNTKEKKNLGVCMTSQQWSKVVYAEGKPMFEGSKEVGPHSQISSKRLDHIHKSHPRGWTTFTTLIQEVDHINKSHPRIFIHVWSWNYDYLDKGWCDHFGTFFLTNVHMKSLNIFLFDLCLHEVVLLDCRNSSELGWRWAFYIFLKEHHET